MKKAITKPIIHEHKYYEIIWNFQEKTQNVVLF